MQFEIDTFAAAHSVEVDWCVGCQCHTVYCPECGNNACGQCARYCGSIEFTLKLQDKLNNLVDNWGKAK